MVPGDGELYILILRGRCQGFVSKDGTITEPPPDVPTAHGRPFAEFEVWVRKQGGTIRGTGWPGAALADNSMLPKPVKEVKEAAAPEAPEWFGTGPARRRWR